MYILNNYFLFLQLSHGKQYENDVEEKYRMKIYMENKRKVLRHNARHAKGEVKYKLALNHFADLVSYTA